MFNNKHLSTIWRITFLSLVIILLVAFGKPALAAPPANDVRTGAFAINTSADPYTLTIPQSEWSQATDGSGDPVYPVGCGNTAGARTLWYSFVAPSSTVQVSLQNSAPQAVVGLFSSSVNRLACDEPSPPSQNYAIFTYSSLTAGQLYYIQIAVLSASDIGSLVLNVDFAGSLPPSSDNVNSAFNITSLPYSNTQNTLSANSSQDGSDPPIGCMPGGFSQQGFRTVWYRYTVSSPISVGISTATSDYDTIINVYRQDGTPPGGLNPVNGGCNDTFGDPPNTIAQARIENVYLTPATYYIEVASKVANEYGVLNISITSHTFNDVPTDLTEAEAFFEPFINRMYSAGITTGCGANPLVYCPAQNVTREEMAVFVVRARNYPNLPYTPPPANNIFTDMNESVNEPFFEPWVERFLTLGITTGCAANPPRYCPTRQVSRAEMAVFLIRATSPAGYQPPPATGIFSDMGLLGTNRAFFEPWIEEYYGRGFTTGCGANPLRYCPTDNVTRGQMAVFIVRAFNLP